jgi:cation diffusion facilitator family transporter
MKKLNNSSKDMEKNNNKNLGYIEGWVSIIINVLLFALKYWVGIVSGSIAILADAWHTLSDSVTSLLVLGGLFVSGKKADEGHPFGHGRAENIVSIIIATLLFVVAFGFIKESVLKIKESRMADFGMLAIAVTASSVIIKEIMARFSIWAGNKIDSLSLTADGWHHRSDAITSAVVLAGIVFGKRFFWIDGLLGIIVSLTIAYAAFEILKEASESLLGEKVYPEVEEQIKTIVCNIAPNTSHIHHMHIHRYGDHTELTLHICFPEDTNLKEAHDISTQIENAIRADMKVEPTIHMEPFSADRCRQK